MLQSDCVCGDGGISTLSYPGTTCSISLTCCSTFTATSIHTSHLPYVDHVSQYGQNHGRLPSYYHSDHCYIDILLHYVILSKKKPSPWGKTREESATPTSWLIKSAISFSYNEAFCALALSCAVSRNNSSLLREGKPWLFPRQGRVQ